MLDLLRRQTHAHIPTIQQHLRDGTDDAPSQTDQSDALWRLNTGRSIYLVVSKQERWDLVIMEPRCRDPEIKTFRVISFYQLSSALRLSIQLNVRDRNCAFWP